MKETSWERAIRYVLFVEAGWANNKHDLGGETFRGIARNYHGDWPGWIIIDQMKSSPDFPKNVNHDPTLKGQAIDFYRENYWDAISGDELPEKLAVMTLDMAVQYTPKTAIRALQSVLGVKSDGIVGQQTVKAAHEREGEAVHWFFYAREDRYLERMRQRPDQRVFAVTWFTRLQELRREVLGFGPPPLAVG